ncbi:MAG: PrsW family intramembrane metalloprotease, partial [Myxococcales bacterium]|nr:PrsW family intramembrane metalloprotease [Myxococcales bacterium]
LSAARGKGAPPNPFRAGNAPSDADPKGVSGPTPPWDGVAPWHGCCFIGPTMGIDLRRAGLVEAAFTGLFIGAVWVADPVTPIVSWWLPPLLALVPSLIWFRYVFRLDRLEPEPWRVVVAVALLAGLLSHTLAEPLARGGFGVEEWGHRSTLSSFVSSTFVVATLEQLSVYLAVRYTVFLTDEFDGRMDGIVYGAAAGLGIATVESGYEIFDLQALYLPPLAVTVVTRALSHVAAGAVLGAALGLSGSARGRGQAILAMGFVLSVLVRGGMRELAARWGVDGLSTSFFQAAAVSIGLGAVVLVFVDLLAARLTRLDVEGSS